MGRKILLALVILLALFFWVMAVTVPMYAATPALLLALALTGCAWWIWKERGHDLETE
jgi:uncharacterized membrane protein YqjE